MKKQIILLLIMAISFSGCMTEKRATKKIAQLGIQYPYAGAQYCANAYPVRVEHTQSIEYREGKRDTLWQAEYIDCDTVIGQDRIVKVPYPVAVGTRDTLIYRDSIFIEKKDKLDICNRDRLEAEERAKTWKKKAYRNTFYGFLAGFVAYFVTSILIKR